MSQSSLVFDVSSLMESPAGSREVYSFELPLEYEGINLTSNTSGKVEIMKIEDGFNARITDLKVNVGVACDKCLKKIDQEIVITAIERQYLIAAPETVEDTLDLYLVHQKDQTIDLGEFLRQEIILHFPLIPVCSKSCKGLCPICGTDRNKKDCHCKPEEIEEYKPLAALKDLLNTPRSGKSN